MIYTEYAHIYDRIGQSRLSRRLAPRAYAMATEAMGAPPTSVLDLCCGTGEAALWFAARGCRVVGVDGSADMLSVAAAKSDRVTWLQQDMRRLDVGAGFDLATCLYDAANYLLTEQDLHETFRGVYRALRPGGLFLFDYNTPYRYATRYAHQTVLAADEPDLFGVYRTAWDPVSRIVTTQVDFFRQEPDGRWRRFTEVHRQKGWTNREWETALRTAGFDPVHLYRLTPSRRPGDYRVGPVKPTTGRVLVLARRPT